MYIWKISLPYTLNKPIKAPSSPLAHAEAAHFNEHPCTLFFPRGWKNMPLEQIDGHTVQKQWLPQPTKFLHARSHTRLRLFDREFRRCNWEVTRLVHFCIARAKFTVGSSWRIGLVLARKAVSTYILYLSSQEQVIASRRP